MTQISTIHKEPSVGDKYPIFWVCKGRYAEGKIWEHTVNGLKKWDTVPPGKVGFVWGLEWTDVADSMELGPIDDWTWVKFQAFKEFGKRFERWQGRLSVCPEGYTENVNE